MAQTLAQLNAAGAIQDDDLCLLYRADVSYSFFGSIINNKVLNVMTTLGDLITSGAAGAPVRLAGNITTTPMYLRSTGSGSAATAQEWAHIAFSDLQGNATIAQGGTNITSYTQYDLLYASATNVLSKLAKVNSAVLCSNSAGLPQWLTTLPAVIGGALLVTDPSQGGANATPLNMALANVFANVTSATNLAGGVLGSTPYQSAVDTTLFVTPNTTTTLKVYTMTGTGSAGAIPVWISAVSANTASTFVFRDASNNFSAGTITAALTGIASGNTTYTANQYGVVLSGAANAMSVLAPDASTTKFLASGGLSANPAWTALPVGSNSQQGIVQVDGTNITATTGTINTVQNISSGSAPSFLGTNFSGTAVALNIGGNAATATAASIATTATSATTATNVAGGGAGQLVVNTAAGATGFIATSATSTFALFSTGTGTNPGYRAIANADLPTTSRGSSGTWVPSDASGASLVFTVTYSTYVSTGGTTTLQCKLTFPSTANTNPIEIGNLPVAISGTATLAIGSYFGVGSGFCGVCDLQTTTITFRDSTGNALQNIQLSTRVLEFTITYQTV